MDQPKIIATYFLIFVARYVVRAHKHEDLLYGAALLIDCGSSVQSNWSINSFYQWQTDEQFIKNGENRILSTNQTSPQMNTLRFFPNGKKNCYKAPFYDGYQNGKYIVRAGFYYGNYDGLNKPPSFALEIDGFFWTNVTTSTSEEPVYYEILYMRKGLQTTVCLVSTGEQDEVPFISSIEAIMMYGDDRTYKMMNNETAFHLVSRINYGANQSIEQSFTRYDEPFTRIWKSKEMPNYINLNSRIGSDGYPMDENYPPWKVMNFAIQANNITESLYLPLNFSSQASLQAYIVLYFMDPVISRYLNGTCKVEIYVDSIKMATSDVPNGFPGDKYRVVSLFPVSVVGGSANLTISQAEGSTLAPILNAIEVFSAFDVSSKGGKLMIVNFFVLFLMFLLHL